MMPWAPVKTQVLFVLGHCLEPMDSTEVEKLLHAFKELNAWPIFPI